jgi:hypothetical protein
MTLSTFKEWPRWVHNPISGEWRVFVSLDAIPADWISAIEAPAIVEAPAAPRHPLDHDGDGAPGGSLPKAPDAPKRKYTRRAR